MPARGRRSPSTSARADLASRLRPMQAELRARLSRADVLADLIRALNVSFEPELVADALVGGVAEWLPISSWLVLSADDGGDVRAMGARGLTPSLEPSATLVGNWVMRTGELCYVDESGCGSPLRRCGRRRRTCVSAQGPWAHGRRARRHRSHPRVARAEIRSGDAGGADAGARARRDRARQRAARAAGRGAVGHRRPDAAVQLALPVAGPAPRDEARLAKRPAAVAAVHRPRRVQDGQRQPRPSVRQPRAGGGRGGHSRQRARDRRRGPVWWRRVLARAARHRQRRARSRSAIASESGLRRISFCTATASTCT